MRNSWPGLGGLRVRMVLGMSYVWWVVDWRGVCMSGLWVATVGPARVHADMGVGVGMGVG